ncbi:MAG: hypothetical protein DWI29_04755 [Planctomycetota bacterium]|nr:MAG: hypothetical protein DWI29_04755 [Planctomycetota bacterium]
MQKTEIGIVLNLACRGYSRQVNVVYAVKWTGGNALCVFGMRIRRSKWGDVRMNDEKSQFKDRANADLHRMSPICQLPQRQLD